jgi:hypothetical protein
MRRSAERIALLLIGLDVVLGDGKTYHRRLQFYMVCPVVLRF